MHTKLFKDFFQSALLPVSLLCGTTLASYQPHLTHVSTRVKLAGQWENLEQVYGSLFTINY